MATVFRYLPLYQEYVTELQERTHHAESTRYKRFKAVLLLQRMARGYLIRKHVAWLSHNATIIQCAYKMHTARIAYRKALKAAVKKKHAKYYATAVTKIQAAWRGYWSRKNYFCYRAYRLWLRTVTERGERQSAYNAEFTLRTRADDLKILEEEARQWLAYVVFKLHHLLRTYNCAGVYSDIASTELSQFERLLTSIKYKEYMKRLRQKYEEFVRKYKPQFVNKKLFPIIGEGTDYWYLSLPEMYEMTAPPAIPPDTRHMGTYHGKIHKEPFFWKKVHPPCYFKGRGPFTPSMVTFKGITKHIPPAPAPTPTQCGDAVREEYTQDPRFNIYCKYYRPRPELMDYVDFHVNVLLKRKCSIEHIHIEEKLPKPCRPKYFK